MIYRPSPYPHPAHTALSSHTMQLTVSALGAIALLPSLALAAPAALDREEASSSNGELLSRALPSSAQTCLNNYPLEKSYPGSSTYSSDSQAQNENLHYSPAAFALPSSAAGAADVVKCVAAQKGKVKMAVRGGGHSYEAYSLGGADNHLVLDMRKFTNISIDSAAKTATIGAGVRLGDLAKTLADKGFALPHGTCAYVGVGGHSLGGGYGYASRPWGYLVDHIVSMQVVKSDGSIVTVSSTQNPDLWYALRGAGQNNFGVVLSFTYALETAPTSTVDFTYGWKSNSDCVEALLALQTLTSTNDTSAALPKNMTAELLWITENAAQGGPACTIGGQHIGATLAQHQAAFQKLRDITKKQGVDIDDSQTQVHQYSSWADALADPNVMAGFDVSDPASQIEPVSLIQTRLVCLLLTFASFSTTPSPSSSLSPRRTPGKPRRIS